MMKQIFAAFCAALLIGQAPLEAAAQAVAAVKAAGGAPVALGVLPAPASGPAVSGLSAPVQSPPAPVFSTVLAPALEAAPALPALAPLEQALAEIPLEAMAELPVSEARAAAGRPFEASARPTPGVSAVGDSPDPGMVQPPSLQPLKPGRFRFAQAALAPFLRTIYRSRVRGLENVPKGGALLLANHVSFVDVLLLAYAVRRPVRGLMYRPIYDRAPWLFRAFGAIPVAAGDSREALNATFALARKALEAGELVVIFPEGALTRNGNMAKFKRGFERVAEGLVVPMVPVHLDGFWGSVFSRKPGAGFWTALTEKLPRPVTIAFGKPMLGADAQEVRQAVQQLGAESFSERVRASAKTLPRAFLETAKKFWPRHAVADSTGKSLSYGKTLTAAILLSGLLPSRLSAAKNVGVLLPPTVGGVLANTALGISGRVPVNLNYTASRDGMDHALAKAGVEKVLTSRAFLEKLKAKTGKTIEVKADFLYLEDMLPAIPKWKLALTFIALRLLPRALIERLFFSAAPRSLDETATILFTSGSSALPKGVELTHANIQSNVEMVREVFEFKKGDSVLGVLPFFHSFGLTVTLWLPLLAGISAAYHTHPTETDAIAALAAKYKPTLVLGTPTFLNHYAKRIPKEAFASVRSVLAGAEKLRPAVAAAFKEKFGLDILEGYGATELSPIASVNLPDDPRQPGTKIGTIGQPLPGVAMRVVHPDTREPLPDGTPGLLLVKGANVMKGYLGEPQKTAEVLEDGWYVTGDMASIDRDGFVTMTGRLSRFTKIAGEMIPHGAVEEKLQQAAGIEELVVTAVTDENGERLVVLYANFDGDIHDVIAKARAAGLPKLWTPAASAFYKVKEIPVLGTGKLDLKAVNELAKQLAK